ncbi:MAG: PDZ domain-containing protein [Fimbriimonadaceae bacterium]|nr:PDZ domain-containing protein [Fimbriimonadaceae bacterium]
MRLATKCFAAFFLAGLALVAGAQTPPAAPAALTKDQKESVLKELEVIVTTKAFVPGIDFAKWPEFLSKQREAIDKAEEAAAFVGAVNRALRDFGLSHIRLQTPRAAAARGRTTTVGPGMQVSKEDSGLLVRAVAEKGPAKEAGLEAGDIIVKVGGNVPDKADAIQGEKGSKLELEVKKVSGETKTVTLELKEYSTVRPETLTWVDPETAMIRVATFSAGYNRANLEKLVGEAAKAKHLIIDLRSNGGGAANNLNHLLSLLMPDGTAYGTFISRRVATKFAEEAKGDAKDPIAIAKWSDSKAKTRKREIEPYAGKIAVLINRGSASASEITAAALQELRGAVVVGTKSAGAVLASVFGRLPEGFAIQYPVSDYVTVKGVRLEKNPVVPDVEVTGPRDGDKDPVVDKAVEALKKTT